MDGPLHAILKIIFLLTGAIPIPGTSMMVDMVTFNKERSFQQKQLGIDKISLMKKAELLQMIKEDLIEVIIGKSSDNEMMKSYYRLMLKSEESMDPDQNDGNLNLMRFSANGLNFLIESAHSAVCFEKVFADEAATKAAKFMIPVVGSAVAAAMSGTSTYGLLKTTLNSSKTLAEQCLEVLKNYFCMIST